MSEKQFGIFGTDLSLPMSENIELIRGLLQQARGKLSDLGFGRPGYHERLKCVEGLLTCGIVTLHYEKEEFLKYEKPADSSRADATKEG